MTATVTTPSKTAHPADGSDRWSVTGEHGKVVYDVLGNHLALIWADGDIDSVMGATLARVREYAALGDDDAVFALLADLYRTELAGVAHPQTRAENTALTGEPGPEVTEVHDIDGETWRRDHNGGGWRYHGYGDATPWAQMAEEFGPLTAEVTR